MPNLFLIDLDHTLFDTEGYKVFITKKLLELFNSENAVEEFWNLEKKLRNEPLHFDKVVEEISNTYPNKTAVKETMEDIFFRSDLSSFVFDDVSESLQQLKQCGTCWLFSTGDLKLQEAKLHSSQLLDQFDAVKVFDNKLLHLPIVYQQFQHTHTIWFIDNHLDYLREAYNKDNNIQTIFINRYNFAKSINFQPTLEVTSLAEFVKHVDHTLQPTSYHHLS